MSGSGPPPQADFSFVSSAPSLKRKQPDTAGQQRAPAPTNGLVPAQRPAANSSGVTQAAAPAQPSVGPDGGAALRLAAGAGPPPAAQQPGPVNTGNAGPSGPPPEQVKNPNAILVSLRQKGNPLLQHVRNVRWQYADILPDYQMGAGTCALFLSLRFHLLKPEYVHHRIKQLQRGYRLRIILCNVDIEDVVEALSQVTRAAVLNDCTLICAFSVQECARYLETFKSFETKPADAIQGRVEEDYLSRLNAAITTIRGVNRTNVLTLGRTFKSVAGMMQASMEELLACPGIGPTKVRRLHDTFHEPFRRTLQQPETGSQPVAGSQPGASGQQQPPPLPQTAGTAAASAAVANDGIAEIGGDEDELEADDPHAGAFAFM